MPSCVMQRIQKPKQIDISSFTAWKPKGGFCTQQWRRRGHHNANDKMQTSGRWLPGHQLWETRWNALTKSLQKGGKDPRRGNFMGE